MTAKCLIPAHNVRVMARAFQALSRIGEDVLIEFGRSEMIFKALSLNQSAYGSFTFRQDFFIDFRNEAARSSNIRDPTARFKVPLRFILPVFKACNIAEHFLDSCEIEVDMPECRLHIRFVKKSRVMHSYSLFIMDGGPIKPKVGKEDMKSHCVASARLLEEILDNFTNNVIEITIEFTEQQFFVSNYSMFTKDPSQQSHVRLFFDMNEFDHYEVDSVTSLTCTLKELKGIVGFMAAGNSVVHSADFNTVTGIPIKLHFTTAGDPLLISIESPRQYEASFVISTTDPPADPSQSNPGSGSSVPHGHSANKAPRISSARSHVSDSRRSTPNGPQANINGVPSANRQPGPSANRPSNNAANGHLRAPPQDAQPEPAENGEFQAPPPSFHPRLEEPVIPEEAVPEGVEVQNDGSPLPAAGESSAAGRVKLPQVSLWMDDSPRDHNSQVVAEVILAEDSDEERGDDDEFYHNFER